MSTLVLRLLVNSNLCQKTRLSWGNNYQGILLGSTLYYINIIICKLFVPYTSMTIKIYTIFC